MKFIKLIEQVKVFLSKYERFLSPAVLLLGFIVDNLTLRRIDLWIENLLIILYLAIAGISILILNFLFKINKSNKIIDFFSKIIPLILQFAFGGLFSVFVVFYSRSATLFTNWPFMLFLLILLIGNEGFKTRYEKLVFQISIYYIAIFSYSVFSLPILLGKIGTEIFFLSGLFSFIFISFFSWILYLIDKEKILHSLKSISISIFIIFFSFNFFYLTKIIPPIPLALKDVGVYHKVQKSGKFYDIEFEPAPWYKPFSEYSSTFHWQNGRPVYFYSAIFAPTKISTNIIHRWSFFNKNTGAWEEKSKLNFMITGGRDGGYRGYSLKYSLRPGKWKVDVMLENEQVIGTKKFSIVETKNKPVIIEGQKF